MTRCHELAESGLADGYDPDTILSIARCGLIADDSAGRGRTLVLSEEPQTLVPCDDVRRRTDRWIDFPGARPIRSSFGRT